MNAPNSSSNLRDLEKLGLKAVKLEQNLNGRRCSQENPHSIITTPNQSSGVNNALESRKDDSDSVLCSTSSVSPAPLSRQFWKAGNYDDRRLNNSNPISQCGSSYLRIHPKFLHSNATSHKWAFGAVAELLDNSIDEIQNGATFVIVDKTSNSRDGTPALLVQDDGGGMDPDAMRRCMSFGFSDKKSKTAIGQYGNGFKTSSMRLGADVVVFSRNMRNRKWTQSVGLLSYTFLMQTRQDRIVVPMVDYQFNAQTGTWDALHNEHHLKTNLSILLQWSPFALEAELMEQCDDIGSHGTKIIIYNLWHKDEGNLELDFESDPEDICISRKGKDTVKSGSREDVNEQHLANRLQYSLRAYLSILYLRALENFSLILRGRVVEYHNIANDLKFPEFINYKPQNVEGSVVTAIGFLKEAPVVNVHGFNVYHKNRLILPFWHVVAYADSRGRGVVGVLEANFIEPTHNKQDFEKTPVFQKLENRLKEMTQEYWDYHCGLIGYQVKKKPRATMAHRASPDSRQDHGIYQPVSLCPDSFGAKPSVAAGAIQHRISAPAPHLAANPRISNQPIHQCSQGELLKRKVHENVLDHGRMKRMGVTGPRTTDNVHVRVVKHAVDPGTQRENQEAFHIIQENKKLHVECQEYEKTQEELNLKVTRLQAEVRHTQREYARLLLESKLLEKVKRENRPPT